MSTTPHAATAGAARQRLAAALGTLQNDPSVPPTILEIVAGLARAMGPLFQLERGNTDLTLFGQARGVLQETLGKMQVVDQSYPGVADATAAIAQSLGMIFQAMRDAGLVPNAPNAPNASGAAAPPSASPGGGPPIPSRPTSPQTPAAFAAHGIAPTAPAPAGPPALAQAPKNLFAPTSPVHSPQAYEPTVSQGGDAGAGRGSQTGGSVPMGPNGLPRLEAEIGVHSETNFYTDFLGDIRNHGGIFVATFHVVPVGTQCEVVLTFPGNLTAELRGVVKWKRENNPAAGSSPGLGIEIVQAPPESWNLIDRFMRKREPIMHEM
jgi:hypothetical protein